MKLFCSVPNKMLLKYRDHFIVRRLSMLLITFAAVSRELTERLARLARLLTHEETAVVPWNDKIDLEACEACEACLAVMERLRKYCTHHN